MDFREKKKTIIELGACDHCLGRQFHGKFKAPNQMIGIAVRKAKTLKEAQELLNTGKEEPAQTGGCNLCSNLFSTIDKALGALVEKTKGLEFSTFLIGCRLPQSAIENEEKLFTIIGMDDVESIKREVNRTLGQAFSKFTMKGVDFKSPEVNIVYDFPRDCVELQINPLFIYGRYQKLERGLPQTKWPCSQCFGKGCKECGGTGKQYKETIEDLLGTVVLEETGGKNTRFHGHGREDKDARMLGNGRPFVLEVEEPKKRLLQWKKLENAINKKYKGKISVSALRPSSREEVVLLKTITFNKTYRCMVKCEAPLNKEELAKINGISGCIISQRTPTRVLHRRADKVRMRKVISIKCRRKGDGKKIECQITAEAGTYVKELITGDFGRTVPSFAGLLGKNCECEELDVIDIIEEKKG
ncbi:tRNA pseudouridine(54/55) synthase Pus10 [archaeon]|nr:tRNA pseudouridine(54/55) synthase Pus10 [archaeon]